MEPEPEVVPFRPAEGWLAEPVTVVSPEVGEFTEAMAALLVLYAEPEIVFDTTAPVFELIATTS